MSKDLDLISQIINYQKGADKNYLDLFDKLNKLSYVISDAQLKLIEIMDELGEVFDCELFEAKAVFIDQPPQRMVKIATPYFPPKLKVVLALESGHSEKSFKKDPYIKSTYKYVREIWYRSLKHALAQAAIPKLMLEKAIIWTVFYVPQNRVRDNDSYSQRFINNALVKYGLLKDDECTILREITETFYDTNPRTEIMLIEDNNILDNMKKMFKNF